MIKFEKIKPGGVYWRFYRVKSGWFSRICRYQIEVLEVDDVGRRVLASCNSNPARWHAERHAVKWYANPDGPKAYRDQVEGESTRSESTG